MKTKLSIFAVVIICLLLTLTFSCKKDPPKVIPTLTTTAATNITSTTATSGGAITSDGNTPVTSRGVCWGINQSPTISDSKTGDGTGIGTFVSSITELSPGVTYYARAYATNAVGTAYGTQITIITTTVLPVLTTTDLLGISSTTATGGGNITSDGGAAVIARGVCWSTNQGPTTKDSLTINGMGIGSFTSSINRLIPGTTYFIRAYATSSIGTAYGNQITFNTAASLPTITTTALSAITSTTATSGGNITSDGGAAVTARGVCWGINQSPTISDSKTSNGTGTGTYTSAITGLSPGTIYYVRAYATNNIGTVYGNSISFTTNSDIIFNPNLSYGTVTDIDGNTYKTILIGSQTWMAENLKTTKYRNGELIGTTTPATLNISAESAPKYQWAYAGNESNVATYGRLYTWYVANDSRKICPNGWKAPSYNEWETLKSYLGGYEVAAGMLKETGTIHWNSPNTGATNNSGFTALPGGLRSNIGIFYYLGILSYWWHTEDPMIEWPQGLQNNWNFVLSVRLEKYYGLYIRCILGETTKPVLTSTAASSIRSTTATSGGNITSDGGAAVIARGVCWSTSQNPTTANSKTTDGTGSGSFTSNLTELTANTTYFARAYAINLQGTAYGEQINFTTSVGLAALTTTAASSVTTITAISGGNIISDGGATVTARGVCWSTSQNPSTDNFKTTDGSGIGNYTSSITNLTPGTTYYVRSYATNSLGTAYGNSLYLITTYNNNSYADGTYKVYQNNTLGQSPCEILFIGDGYVTSDFVYGGLFDQDANSGIEAIFSVEPYKTYRKYFKVYKQAAYSKDSGVTQEDKGIIKETCFSTEYFTPTGETYSARMNTNTGKVLQYAKIIHNLDDTSNMVIVLIVNQDRYDGVSYSGVNLSLAVCPVSKSGGYTNYFNIIFHEALGHGWGKLADEYIFYYNQTIPEKKKQEIANSPNSESGANIDITNDLTQIKWKHFINKVGYQRVGAYEGAFYYSYGIWRPEVSSCMIFNEPYFNAPSREAIVKRIMNVSGGVYSLENFVSNDIQKEPSANVLMLTKSINPLTFKPLPPPITVWRKY